MNKNFFYNIEKMSMQIIYGFCVTPKCTETVWCHAIEAEHPKGWNDLKGRNIFELYKKGEISQGEYETAIRKCPVEQIFQYDDGFFTSSSPTSDIRSFNLSMKEIVVGMPVMRSVQARDSPQAPFLLVEQNQRDEFFQHWKHFRELMPRTSYAISQECGVPRFYYICTNE